MIGLKENYSVLSILARNTMSARTIGSSLAALACRKVGLETVKDLGNVMMNLVFRGRWARR